VAIAGAAGQVIPRLGEPGGWKAAGQIFEFAAAEGIIEMVDASAQASAPGAASMPAASVSSPRPAIVDRKAREAGNASNGAQHLPEPSLALAAEVY
jgi:hypothetical protein